MSRPPRCLPASLSLYIQVLSEIFQSKVELSDVFVVVCFFQYLYTREIQDFYMVVYVNNVHRAVAAIHVDGRGTLVFCKKE